MNMVFIKLQFPMASESSLKINKYESAMQRQKVKHII